MNTAEKNSSTKLKKTEKSNTSLVMTILTAIGVLAAICIPFIVEYIKEKRAELSIVYALNRPLVSVDPARSDGLTLFFNDIRVTAPWIILVRIENNSELPIDSQDVREPLTIEFSNARLLRATITERRPPWVRAEIAESDSRISVSFNLLNRSEAIFVELLFDQRPNNIHSFFHLRGGEPLRVVNEQEDTRTIQKLVNWLPSPVLTAFFAISMIGFLGYVMNQFDIFLRSMRPVVLSISIQPNDELDAILLSSSPSEFISRTGISYRLPKIVKDCFYGAKISYEDGMNISESDFISAIERTEFDRSLLLGKEPKQFLQDARSAYTSIFRNATRSAIDMLPRDLGRNKASEINSIFKNLDNQELLLILKNFLDDINYRTGIGGNINLIESENSSILTTISSGMMVLSGIVWIIIILSIMLST